MALVGRRLTTGKKIRKKEEEKKPGGYQVKSRARLNFKDGDD